MTINKNLQYAILFMFYLHRAGRANVETAAENLNIPLEFLQQLSRVLRISGIVKSFRGPGGGYEIVGEPTFEDVFDALDPIEIIKGKDHIKYATGEAEHRSLLNFAGGLRSSMKLILKRKIKDLCNETQVNEGAMMKRADVSHGGH